MSIPFRGRDVSPARKEPSDPVRPGRAAPGSTPNWAERMHSAPTRHEAITRNLNTWSSYKSWAERMRSTWQGDAEREAPQERNSGGYRPPNH